MAKFQRKLTINKATKMSSINEMSSTNSNNSSLGIDLPDGYSTGHIILTSILISVIMFVIIFGNLLVVIAIFTDKTLKTVQNWFIASLAVADFLLGLVIMPFSLANEMMGYWYFGRVWCDLWKAIDVLLCTASICSICLISLDRYWSITRAVTYSRQRTAKRAALMIAAVWCLSAVICVPPLIGWKNPLPVSDYPLCLLSDDIGYVLYSTMGSFYIPCVIMVFVYFKIYRAATRLARKNIKTMTKSYKGKAKMDIQNGNETDSLGSFVEKESNKKPMELNESLKRKTIPSLVEDLNGSPLVENRVLHSDRVTTDIAIIKNSISNQTGSKISHNLKDIDENVFCENCTDLTNNGVTDTDIKCIGELNNPGKKVVAKGKRCRTSKKKHRENGNKGTKEWRAASLRDHERHKRKIAKARERRATIVLGLVMAAFILCWFPFFTLYIITSFCDCIGGVVFTIVFWAGYCNSALNPIIYTIFNRDFRHAFHKLLSRKSRWI
ncbi:alpha-2A adrenergic receptor-like [Mya arenaria]|uniref:alpha-2A adrenergic receptor-like n=1 Tax=Mya arenaria TaxID=6604 RepID=UPI0022E5A5EC|nr:alpha-2A adrenergic receptor-like [Mya arenaria]